MAATRTSRRSATNCSPSAGAARRPSCPGHASAGEILIRSIDTVNDWFGKLVCLLVIPIIFAMVYEVIARKFFIAPTLWAFDVSRMLYGMCSCLVRATR